MRYSILYPSCLVLTSSLVLSDNSFWTRDNPTETAYVAPATISGAPTSGFVSGAKAVATQLKKDASAAVSAFAQAITGSAGDSKTQSSNETAQLFNTIVKGAMSFPINQSFGGTSTPSQDRLNSMAATINATLNSIESTASKMLNSTNGALHYNDLKDCISGLVQQGGLHSGESCVVQGMSVTGVSDMMTSVLKTFGNNGIPTSILSQTAKALDPTFTAVLPGEKQFYDSVNNAITSVQASVSGQLVAALNDAQNCFQQAMQMSGTYDQKIAFTQDCTRNPTGKSVYNDLKTLYLSITNQMVGYLQPNIIDSIHQIADNYLDPADPKSDAAYFRAAIANTTASIVASNAGNQVTYAYKLANCLDSVIGTTSPQAASNIAATKDCLSKPDGPPASIKEIVYGYIQQIYGVLPPQLAAKIEATGVAKLDPSDPNYQSKVQALHATFEKTDPGPAYVTCYETFVDCLFNNANGALTHPGNTQSVCLLGDACQKTPDGKANSPVQFGRRSTGTPVKNSRREAVDPTAKSTPSVKYQRATIVRKYHITPRAESYLLTSFNRVFGPISTHKRRHRARMY